MKKILVFAFLLLLAGNLFAQENSEEITEQIDSKKEKAELSIDGFSIGLGPELNIYTRDGFAVGGTLIFGVDFNPSISSGIRASFFNDLDTISVFEAQAFFRYYLPRIQSIFFQADAGAMFAFENGGTYPAPALGAALGYRLNLAEKYFIDFTARFGYPYMTGISITAGIKFAEKNIPEGIIEGAYNE